MRLSPKSIFVGLIALGLPFAVTVGWTLGSPFAADEPPSAAAPGGSGAIGGAPVKDTTSPRPVWLPGRYEAGKPERAAATAPSALPLAPELTPPSSSTSSTTTPRGPLITLTTLPPLTDPPVPTPTMVTSEPPPPSATPSSEPPSSSSGGIGAGLLRRH